MATTTTTTAPASGALASVTGFFGDIIKTSLPVVTSYLDNKSATEQARAAASASTANTIANGGYANGAGATTKPITQQAWFPFAIGGGVLLVVGVLFLVLRRKN
jgi:hypothetical protein